VDKLGLTIKEIGTIEKKPKPGVLVHTYNASYSGG
jgi:hypothetical protein